MLQYINLSLLILPVYASYKLVNRFYPVINIALEVLPPREELDLKYKRYFTLGVIANLLAAPLLTWGFHWLLDYLIAFRIGFIQDVLQVILPDQIVVWIAAALMALLTGSTIISAISYNYVLTDWEEYLGYVNMRVRFNLAVTYNVFRRRLTFIMLVFIIMLFDWFTVFGEEEIKVNRFWGLATTKYSYAHIAEINQVEKSRSLLTWQMTDAPHYVIVFKDGVRWNSRYNGFNDPKRNEVIISIVTKRANVYIRQLETE